MGKIVEFEKNKFQLEYDEFVNSDDYLKMTAINLLKEFDYSFDNKGIKEMQNDLGLEETGIISANDIMVLANISFDANNCQNILNHIVTRYEKENENKVRNQKYSKYQKKQKRALVIGTIIIFIYTLIGFISFWKWLPGLLF